MHKIKEIDLFIESNSSIEWIVYIISDCLLAFLFSICMRYVGVEVVWSPSRDFLFNWHISLSRCKQNTTKCLPFSSKRFSTLLKVTFCICLQFSLSLFRWECMALHCYHDVRFSQQCLLSVIWFIVCIFFCSIPVCRRKNFITFRLCFVFFVIFISYFTIQCLRTLFSTFLLASPDIHCHFSSHLMCVCVFLLDVYLCSMLLFYRSISHFYSISLAPSLSLCLSPLAPLLANE